MFFYRPFKANTKQQQKHRGYCRRNYKFKSLLRLVEYIFAGKRVYRIPKCKFHFLKAPFLFLDIVTQKNANIKRIISKTDAFKQMFYYFQQKITIYKKRVKNNF